MAVVPTRYWHPLEDGRVQCDLCPRECRLQEGQRGLCFVRGRLHGEIVLTTWGRSSGFCVDPIEKKPLNHFYPGSPTLSFGTAGCNLSCRFCQNWDISKSRQMDSLQDQASPRRIGQTAVALGCRSVAYTYNDPVIFHEYALDVAAACRAEGVLNVAVTAGYISPAPREAFFGAMDAANIDLKAFTDDFYWKMTGARLAPVLETIEYVHHETPVWLELTTLLIPGYNDSDSELEKLTTWIADRLGVAVPLHFSAFHPDHRLLEAPATPPSTLSRARHIAMANGLRYVYTGNVHNEEGGSSWCHHCGALLIERDWYRLGHWGLDDKGCCGTCGTVMAGRFDTGPGRWGPQRLPVRMD